MFLFSIVRVIIAAMYSNVSDIDGIRCSDLSTSSVTVCAPLLNFVPLYTVHFPSEQHRSSSLGSHEVFSVRVSHIDDSQFSDIAPSIAVPRFFSAG